MSQGPYYAGVDIGSTMTKVAIVGDGLVASLVGPTGAEHRRLAHRVMGEALAQAGLTFADLSYVVATGYGRINVPFADKQVTEISCHGKGLHHLLPAATTVIEIGGQDSKAIKLKNGKVTDFVMNDKCAAGTGRFLEIIAETLGVALADLGSRSLQASRAARVSNLCTVFAEHEVGSMLVDGEPVENLIAGIHEAIAARTYALARRVKVEPELAITGGGAKNIGLVRALEGKFGCPFLVPSEPLLTGAIGAALIGKDICTAARASGIVPARSATPLQAATFFAVQGNVDGEFHPDPRPNN